MRPKSKMLDVHQVFQEFADGTSMHGVPRIINARSVTARIFWSIICLGAFGMFFWQCGILLERYYSYPKKVNVEILQRPVPFPAVSVCNVDNLDYAIIDKLYETIGSFFLPTDMNSTDEEANDYYDNDYETTQDSGFVAEYKKFFSSALYFMQGYDKLYYSYTPEIMIEAMSRLALPANLGVKNTSLAGPRLRDFIIKCRFLDEDCNITQSFESFFDPYYFNCFTFNPEHIISTRSMQLRGIDYGLSLVLFTGSGGQFKKHVIFGDGSGQVYIPGLEESKSALASGKGARVVVHSPGTNPFPTAEGYDIPPGFSVTIGVKARENKRIAGNHGNCTKDNATGVSEKHYKYTLIWCQNNCIQKHIMKKCKCVDNRLSIPTNTHGLPFCFEIPNLESCAALDLSMESNYCDNLIIPWQKRMECRQMVYDDMTIHKPEAMESCKCYPPCSDIVYDSSYSLSTVPEDPKEHTGVHLVIGEFIESLDDERKDILKKRFESDGENVFEKGLMRYVSRLNVHIADNNIMKTTESPDYEAIRLVSDIGGQLGLWIGISVMTLFEVLQLIADVFRFLTSKGRNVGEKKLEVPNTISGMKHPYGNGDRFRHDFSDIELPCEIDKLTTV